MAEDTPRRQAVATPLIIIGSGLAGLLAGVMLMSAAVGPRDTAPTSVTETRLVTLEKSSKEIQKDYESFKQAQQQFNRENVHKTSITLNVSSQSYDWISTDLGVFFILVADVKPYADGQRLTLRIGNPHSASFRGFKGSFAYPTADSFSNKDEDFTEALSPGSWTNVVVTLPKLPTNKLDSIYFSMEMNQIALSK
jgi:thioredoxin reductase